MEHTGHELMFRNRFWVSLVLTVPVLLYSSTVQGWLNFTMPAFSGAARGAHPFSQWSYSSTVACRSYRWHRRSSASDNQA